MPANQNNNLPKDPLALIRQFIDEMIEKAGFSDMPADFQNRYKEKLEVALHKKIGTFLNNLLKDEDVEELGKFLQANPNFTNEALFKFYNSKIPDLPEKIAEAMKAFRQDFLNLALKTAGRAGVA